MVARPHASDFLYTVLDIPIGWLAEVHDGLNFLDYQVVMLTNEYSNLESY